jgi:hypothetical protein
MYLFASITLRATSASSGAIQCLQQLADLGLEHVET